MYPQLGVTTTSPEIDPLQDIRWGRAGRGSCKPDDAYDRGFLGIDPLDYHPREAPASSCSLKVSLNPQQQLKSPDICVAAMALIATSSAAKEEPALKPNHPTHCRTALSVPK